MFYFSFQIFYIISRKIIGIPNGRVRSILSFGHQSFVTELLLGHSFPCVSLVSNYEHFCLNWFHATSHCNMILLNITTTYKNVCAGVSDSILIHTYHPRGLPMIPANYDNKYVVKYSYYKIHSVNKIIQIYEKST